jgi:predicted CXXCH cytochrome family protein
LVAAALGFSLVLALHALGSQSSAANKSNSSAANWEGYVGMEACSGCHATIFAAYAKTAMAQASGPAMQHLVVGEFDHAPSGVHYRVYAEKGQAWLSFERRSEPAMRGTRQLLYFIGSGARGRTYLFSVDGFVFESPINWYSQKDVWDMAPAYQSARQIPLNLPAVPSCLSCHTSNMQAPLAGTENRYAVPLFAHDGITCERCHGPGKAHVNKTGPIVNPAKLSASRGDAICMQCHLEASVAIERPGRHLYDFAPGEDLAEYVRYFVYTGDTGEGRHVFSQFEALAQSVCKRKSGDAMSCTSCHDPHSSPSPAERVSFYRSKCLACHGDAFGAKHHAENPNCVQCHMPRVGTAEISHTQATDHRILRTPAAAPQDTAAFAAPRMMRFPPEEGKGDARDLALAWMSQVEAGGQAAGSNVEQLLQEALRGNPDDPALLAGAGYFAQRSRKIHDAREDYERALKLDPTNNDAATNLGVIEAQEGQLDHAIALWRPAFDRAPARSAIGMNLVRAYCAEGQAEEARTYASRVLQFNPDLAEAIRLMGYLNADPPRCEGQ